MELIRSKIISMRRLFFTIVAFSGLLAGAPKLAAQFNPLHFLPQFSRDQYLWATGSNKYGQLATMSSATSIPTQVAGISGVTAVGNASAYGRHFCVVVSGTVRCWGSNFYGELGHGVSTLVQSAVTVPGITNATAVATGSIFTCALLADGTVKCWGYGLQGQLGNGSEVSQTTPVTVTGISNAVKIAAGFNFACAVLSTGSVKCWGSNSYGQLGDGSNTNASTPVTVQGITTAVDVDAGTNSGSGYATFGGHACALLSSGQVWCWGAGGNGQLGNGSEVSKNTPVQASGISTATQISLGSLFTCARLSNGTVWCWGDNAGGKLGNSSYENSPVPVQVTGIMTATQVAATWGTACARLSDGTLQCWGNPEYWEFGPYPNTNRLTPSLSSVGTYTEIFGSWGTMCGRKSDNTVNCWGQRGYGQLGDGYYNDNSLPGRVFQRTSPLNGVVDLSLRFYVGCAVLNDGTVKCWGDNSTGALGNGTTENTAIPATVSGITNATKVRVSQGYDGATFACALVAGGNVKCWGYSNSTSIYGIANGYTTNQLTPVTIPGISNAVDLSLGYYHACVVLSSGSVQCWGAGNYGALGRGSSTSSSTPVTVTGITTATSIASGGWNNCAVLADTSVRCWGQNELGQLGDGTTTVRNTGTAVSGLTGAVAVSCGASHCCSMLSGGGVKCWGAGDQGRLGNGSNSDALTPVSVDTSTGMGSVTKISANAGATAALTSDGQLWVWGWGDGFGLGTGNGTDQLSPVARGGKWSQVAVGYQSIMVYPAP